MAWPVLKREAVDLAAVCEQVRAHELCEQLLHHLIDAEALARRLRRLTHEPRTRGQVRQPQLTVALGQASAIRGELRGREREAQLAQLA